MFYGILIKILSCFVISRDGFRHSFHTLSCQKKYQLKSWLTDNACIF